MPSRCHLRQLDSFQALPGLSGICHMVTCLTDQFVTYKLHLCQAKRNHSLRLSDMEEGHIWEGA